MSFAHARQSTFSRMLALATVTLVMALLTLAPLQAQAGGAACAAAAAAANHGKVTLLYHGAVQGKLLDCGCKAKPLGGLARRAALIDQLRAGEPNVLLADAGNLCGDDSAPMRAQTEFLLGETAKLGYDAIGVGAAELRLGADRLARAQHEQGLPFTSANVLREGKPLLPAYRVVERGGLRVGFVSVTAPLPASSADPQPSLEVADAQTCLQAVLPELRAKSDLVVLLSDLPKEQTEQLLGKCSGDSRVDLVVDGTSSMPLAERRTVGTTTWVCANSQGKVLGQIALQLGADKQVVASGATMHELALSLPEDPQIAARVTSFVQSTTATTAAR